MAIKVQMRHRRNGLYKNGFVGFSWTYLFFGFMVPLLRGHYRLALYHFLIFFFSIVLFGSVIIIQPLMSFFFIESSEQLPFPLREDFLTQCQL